MTRRSFFNRFSKAILSLAVAPVIVREVIAAQMPGTVGIYEQMIGWEPMPMYVPDKLNLEELFKVMHEIKRARAAYDSRIQFV